MQTLESVLKPYYEGSKARSYGVFLLRESVGLGDLVVTKSDFSDTLFENVRCAQMKNIHIETESAVP